MYHILLHGRRVKVRVKVQLLRILLHGLHIGAHHKVQLRHGLQNGQQHGQLLRIHHSQPRPYIIRACQLQLRIIRVFLLRLHITQVSQPAEVLLLLGRLSII